MDKKNVVVVLGTAHRLREPGKMSPDKELREALYSRSLVAELKPKLESCGVQAEVDLTDNDLPKDMQTPSAKLERSRELALRVNRVNEICKDNPGKQVIYVSLHLDASGSDGQWHQANGWSVRVSTRASQKSKALANSLFDAAKASGLRVRQPMPTQKYWEQSLYVLNNTPCPAVLTENLFMDNVDDKTLLMSDAGRHIIERLHVEGILRFIESL